ALPPNSFVDLFGSIGLSTCALRKISFIESSFLLRSLLDKRHNQIAITVLTLACFPNITTALGNGAEFLLSPNFKRPLTSLISPFIQYSCHHLVSVLAGNKQTTVAPFKELS